MGYELDAEVLNDELDRLLAKLNGRYHPDAQSAGPVPVLADYRAGQSAPRGPAARPEDQDFPAAHHL
jgi:hypothetical protein